MNTITGLDDKEQLLLIKTIYTFGFEVGYYNHSEIGWVLREYTRLMEEARKLGIKLPESHYNNGKIKGKSSRCMGMGEFFENKGLESHTYNTKVDLNDVTDKFIEKHFLKKPSLSDVPGLIKKTGMLEIPKFLYGHRFFEKK